MIPYAPSLSKTPARIILPDTGASTWAFGSHRCVVNIGIFTRNAMRQNIHHTCSESLDEEGTEQEYKVGSIVLVRKLLLMISNLISKGKEATVVYIMRYMLA